MVVNSNNVEFGILVECLSLVTAAAPVVPIQLQILLAHDLFPALTHLTGLELERHHQWPGIALLQIKMSSSSN